MTSESTAFAVLYERQAPQVRRFLLFLCGDEGLADELTSETFVRAWTAFARIRQQSVKAYLYTIARNLLRDARRNSARFEPFAGELEDDGASIHQRMEDSSELAALLTAMQRLSEEDRAALLMRADQLPYEDIAQALNLSVPAAKVRVHRARVKLHQWTAAPKNHIGEMS